MNLYKWGMFMATFFEKYTMLCKEKGVSPSRVCEEIGITRSACYRWKNGSYPRNPAMRQLADYFGVPIDFLKDDTIKDETLEKKTTPKKKSKTSPIASSHALTKQETELLEIYRSLSLSGQVTMIQTALELKKAQQ